MELIFSTWVMTVGLVGVYLGLAIAAIRLMWLAGTWLKVRQHEGYDQSRRPISCGVHVMQKCLQEMMDEGDKKND